MITSPGCTETLVQPILVSADGLPNSAAQYTSSPLSSLRRIAYWPTRRRSVQVGLPDEFGHESAGALSHHEGTAESEWTRDCRRRGARSHRTRVHLLTAPHGGIDPLSPHRLSGFGRRSSVESWSQETLSDQKLESIANRRDQCPPPGSIMREKQFGSLGRVSGGMGAPTWEVKTKIPCNILRAERGRFGIPSGILNEARRVEIESRAKSCGGA